MDRHKYEFAVGRLPHQEIRQPLFAAGANDQIGIGNVGCVKVLTKRVGVDRRRITFSFCNLAREPLRRMGDFMPRPVVEGDHEIEAIIVPRQVFGLFQKRADIGLQSLALADHPNPDTVAMQRRQVVADKAPQQAEQIADFGRRTRPVFGAEGEDRQVENAEFA
ncbi:hypothetical protein GALL_505390 [mine drainage metagenome]|uniref:Uncharacterized protein n=1 Tax=mine drainage metagenome TaxID=410659 RepID=A0A1J5PAY0_9ZZZZ